MWAFGGALGSDKTCDYRKLFSEWWRQEWSRASFRFPEEGQVFDYFVDMETKRAIHWREVVPTYTHVVSENASFASIVVPTVQSTRLSFMIDMPAAKCYPVMLVGTAGSAKTTIFNDKLKADREKDKGKPKKGAKKSTTTQGKATAGDVGGRGGYDDYDDYGY